MLSIVPGDNANNNGVGGLKGPKPSRSVFAGARKLVQSLSGSGANAQGGTNNNGNGGGEVTKKQRAKKPATLEDIDKILEKDALDLTNMKREVIEAQNAEINKAQAALTAIQREHDAIRVANNTKEKELNHIMDTIRTLSNVGVARVETTDAANTTKQALNEDCEQTLENLAAELRTLQMQNLMASRLEKEIVETKTECALVSINHEQVKHDLAGLESTLRLCRQELLESEKELENLMTTVKSRKEEREVKMGLMFGIVSESQSSVLKIRKELEHSMVRA
jgi:DNA repair exonuclease SbcCD ATPase subunit